MNATADEAPVRPGTRLSLVSVLSLLTAVAASGGVTLHLMGNAMHTSYLGYWGLDASRFPKATDWMLITGYSTLFERALAFAQLTGSNLVWPLAAFVSISVYFALLQLPLVCGLERRPDWLARQSQHVRRWLDRTVLALMVGCGAVLVLLCASLALAFVPAVPGARAGQAAVEREVKDFAKGYAQATAGCVQLKKGTDLAGQGFILDSSTTHIAIFDVTHQSARSIPREGSETVAMRLLKF